MSARDNFLRAEMEVNPRLQNAIVAHHIIQVVSPVVVIIIYVVAASPLFLWPLMILISSFVPGVLFVVFWIASKCNYQDLRAILVHFNALLSTLWFLVFFPFFIICSLFHDGLVAIITGVLSLSSAFFATYGIWKSARNVALRARSAKDEHDNALVRFLSPVPFTDLHSIQLPPVTYNQPVPTE